MWHKKLEPAQDEDGTAVRAFIKVDELSALPSPWRVLYLFLQKNVRKLAETAYLFALCGGEMHALTARRHVSNLEPHAHLFAVLPTTTSTRNEHPQRQRPRRQQGEERERNKRKETRVL